MRQRSLVILTSVLTTGALTLTACGSRDDSGDKGGDSGSDTTFTIGVDAPLSGENSTTGLGIQYGAQIAIDDANKNNWVPGVKFKLKALDDKAQPATGQSNATALTGDKSVVGAVGPLNSGVAQTMQQVFASANMVQISPANTAPELTQGKNWQTDKKRPFKTYFRTATTDELQGSFAAGYAYNGLKKKKAFVVDDKQTYGAGLAKIFNEQYKKLGGKVPTDINDLRSKVVDGVQKSDFEGLTGKISFDQYGDTTNKQLTVYQVEKGAWKDVETGTADLK